MAVLALALACTMLVHPAAAGRAIDDGASSKLEQQVEGWVLALAKQKAFSDWQDADRRIEALGPGTHGWLVLLTAKKRPIGYLIVNAVEDGGYQLAEYGRGPYPLFSQQKLKQALLEEGYADKRDQPVGVRHYLHPFAAVWEVGLSEGTIWLDGKTAEWLPIQAASLAEQSEPASTLLPSERVVRHRLNETFDVYERLPWLTKDTVFPADNERKLKSRLNQGKPLRYIAEPYGDAMLYALPVIGYLQWSNGRLDVALDADGERYIALDVLLQLGRFYN